MGTDTTVTVNIRGLAFGGAGVGEVIEQSDYSSDLLGITAFVPFTAPGEKVKANIVERKQRYLSTQLIEVLDPAFERIEPKCRYFRECGGCELQHLQYDAQLRAKLEMIRGALASGKVSRTVIDTLQPIIQSEPYGYRRRVSLHVSNSGLVGFYREHSRSIVAIERCEVAVESISQSLARIRDLGRFIAGKISSIIIEADDKGIIAVLKAPYDLTPNDKNQILTVTKDFFPNAVLIAAERDAGGFGRQILELPLKETGGLTLQIPAGSFSQVNWGVNKKLIEYALRSSSLTRNANVLDLYAGAGNFALPYAADGMRVTAVETNTRLVNLGRKNAERHRLERQLNFVESSVERFLSSNNKKSFDCIVADPPRSGLGALVKDLPSTSNLILISCHLPSFVRDIKALTTEGYVVNSIQPFDMFSQTSYTEIATVLRR